MRIVTWNIQWGRGCDGRVDLARIVRSARETADFDLLCLQEVAVGFHGLPGSRGEDQVATLRGLLPGYAMAFGIATDLPDGHEGRSQFGNLVMSRLPLRQVLRHLLPWPADAAVPSMQRLALEVVVEAPRGPLRVLTTHLEYYSVRAYGRPAWGRLARPSILLQFLFRQRGYSRAGQRGCGQPGDGRIRPPARPAPAFRR